MHVVKEFAAPVLVDDVQRPVERIHQMPVPVVQINADVLAEIADPVLRVEIVGRVIARYFDRNLLHT